MQDVPLPHMVPAGLAGARLLARPQVGVGVFGVGTGGIEGASSGGSGAHPAGREPLLLSHWHQVLQNTMAPDRKMHLAALQTSLLQRDTNSRAPGRPLGIVLVAPGRGRTPRILSPPGPACQSLPFLQRNSYAVGGFYHFVLRIS